MTRHDAHAALFAALRADLLRGDLGRLDAHIAALTALADSIGRDAADVATLARIRAEAERSRGLISAASGGVRATLRRLGEAGAPSAVYTSGGSRHPLSPATPSSESRA